MSVVNLSNENFEEIVLDGEKPVLIDFWASWCIPCRMQSPVVDNLAGEIGDRAVVAKLNVDENPELAAQFNVMSIPTLILVKDGRIVGRKTGLSTKAALLSMFDAVRV